MAMALPGWLLTWTGRENPIGVVLLAINLGICVTLLVLIRTA